MTLGVRWAYLAQFYTASRNFLYLITLLSNELATTTLKINRSRRGYRHESRTL